MKSLSTLWKNRNQIVEGIKNSIFKKEHIEEVAQERMMICEDCNHLDKEGAKCLVSGTQPCCGKCGCSLRLKLRSLSSGCGDEENPKWNAIISEEEEDLLKESLDYKEEE